MRRYSRLRPRTLTKADGLDADIDVAGLSVAWRPASLSPFFFEPQAYPKPGIAAARRI